MKKKLAQAKKMLTFAPAITAKFLLLTEGGEGRKKKKFFFLKSLPEIKKGLPLHPARAEVHWESAQAAREKRE